MGLQHTLRIRRPTPTHITMRTITDTPRRRPRQHTTLDMSTRPLRMRDTLRIRRRRPRGVINTNTWRLRLMSRTRIHLLGQDPLLLLEVGRRRHLNTRRTRLLHRARGVFLPSLSTNRLGMTLTRRQVTITHLHRLLRIRVSNIPARTLPLRRRGTTTRLQAMSRLPLLPSTNTAREDTTTTRRRLPRQAHILLRIPRTTMFRRRHPPHTVTSSRMPLTGIRIIASSNQRHRRRLEASCTTTARAGTSTLDLHRLSIGGATALRHLHTPPLHSLTQASKVTTAHTRHRPLRVQAQEPDRLRHTTTSRRARAPRGRSSRVQRRAHRAGTS